jgi:hypothetical protein
MMIRIRYYPDDATGGGPVHTLTLPPDTKRLLKIKDTRKTDYLSGKKIDHSNDFSKDIDQDTAAAIIKEAKKKGIDPYTALAISYQETGINKEHPFDLNPDVYGKSFGNAQEGINSIYSQFQYAKKLQDKGVIKKGEDYFIQGYNGYGKIKRGHIDLEGAHSIYGRAIPESGIDLKEDPLYGKRILDIRDNILKNNPDIKNMIEATEQKNNSSNDHAFGHGPPDIGIDTNEDSGDDPPKKLPPKGYIPTTPVQRRDWNDMLDQMQKDGVAGSKDLDQPDKNVGKSYIEKYRKDHPGTTVSEDLIPHIQYEQQAFRTGDEFPGLSKEQLGVLRKQVNPDYLKRPTADPGTPFNAILSREYYPQFKKGDKSYGTDMEGYLKDLSKPPAKDAPNPEATQPIEKNTESEPEVTPDKKNTDMDNLHPKVMRDQRNKLYHKYGKGSEDVVDMPEFVGFKPSTGTDTMGNIVKKVGAKVGVRPSILLASSLVEGANGLESGTDPKKAEDYSGDENYPVSGYVNFGLDTFSDKFPELVKKGYLSKDFASEFKKSEEINEKKEKVNSADFKTADAAFEAKAAMIKDMEDQTDAFAKSKGIKLSNKGRDFFTLVGYNGGDGLMKQMMESYNSGGYLKDDKYIDQRPTDSYKSVHREISKRIKGAEILDSEKYL